MEIVNLYKAQKADFSLLPIVAIQNIYKYLHYNDIKAASETCNNWRTAALCDSFYVSNTIVNVDSSEFDSKLVSPIFRNFRLTRFTNLGTFADSCSSIVRELTLNKVETMFATICGFLERFENLEKLTLNKCVLKYSVSKEQSEAEVLEVMKTVTHLTCEDCKIEEDHFVILLAAFPNLQYLKVRPYFSDSYNNYMCLRQRAKRRGKVIAEKDAAASFIENTFGYLPSNLKELHFISFPCDLSCFIHCVLPQSFNNLKLKIFTFNEASMLLKTCRENVLKTQTNLVHLNLSYCSWNHALFDHIIENLHSLEKLILRNSYNLDNADISKLSKFSNQLRVLDISYSGYYSDDEIILSSKGIVDGIAVKENKCLEELHLLTIPLYRDDIFQCIRNLPNLKVLNLKREHIRTDFEIDDDAVEYISNMLPNLEDLSLSTFYNITNDTLKHLKKLKNLRSLNLSYMHNVNDETLINDLHFPNLKRLSLEVCQQITEYGLKALSQNCPVIEDLNLSGCRNIDHNTVMMILESFHRLKSLDIGNVEDKDAIKIAAKNYRNVKEIKMYVDKYEKY